MPIHLYQFHIILFFEKSTMFLNPFKYSIVLLYMSQLIQEEQKIDANIISEIKKWDELEIHSDILRGIYAYGFERPSPIQSKAIVPILQKRDIIAQAQSGTGKTAAFTIGALGRIDPLLNATQVLVLAPTRELTKQIAGVFTILSSMMKDIRIKTLVGGTSTEEDVRSLRRNTISQPDLMRISSYLFEFASTNRYFSKLYADLYTELVNKYECMKETIDNSFRSFLELFANIEYVDPDVNYDEFCRINKINEKRKSLSTFFMNLSANNLLSRDKMVELTYIMIQRVIEYIPMADKKAHVDEYTENIAILFNKDIYANISDKLIDGKTIIETIQMLATSKAKTYPGLSSKCIFKYMDLIDM